jgi:hypothetical protein
MNTNSFVIGLVLSFVIVIGNSNADAKKPVKEPSIELLVSGLAGGSGSAIGHDGALYVTEAHAGRISRVDPQTGAITTFASGLPLRMPGFPFGGVVDVAFIGKTAYALVTLVGPDVGGSDIVGIYRVDGPDSFTVVADIGEFNSQNPPSIPFPFFVPSGAQYALENFRGGFLVTDGHLNRVLQVKLNGEITEVIGFGNIVPTGLAVSGNTIYMGQAGPVPHLPENGKVVAVEVNGSHCGNHAKPPHGKSKSKQDCLATEVASGEPLIVDVEFGRGRRLYALSQGPGQVGAPDGTPAVPNTGALVEVNENGTFTVVVEGLDQPTSLDFIGNTAYIVTYGGELWKIDNVSAPPFGASR